MAALMMEASPRSESRPWSGEVTGTWGVVEKGWGLDREPPWEFFSPEDIQQQWILGSSSTAGSWQPGRGDGGRLG